MSSRQYKSVYLLSKTVDCRGKSGQGLAVQCSGYVTSKEQTSTDGSPGNKNLLHNNYFWDLCFHGSNRTKMIFYNHLILV